MELAYIEVAMTPAKNATQNVLRPRKTRNTPLALRVTKDFKELVSTIAAENGVSQVDVVMFAVNDCVRRKAFNRKMKETDTQTATDKE